jgi:hypothetical protein
MTIWYNIWPFGIVCGHLVYIFPFWYVWTKKIWQPWVTDTHRVCKPKKRALSKLNSRFQFLFRFLFFKSVATTARCYKSIHLLECTLHSLLKSPSARTWLYVSLISIRFHSFLAILLTVFIKILISWIVFMSKTQYDFLQHWPLKRRRVPVRPDLANFRIVGKLNLLLKNYLSS